MTLRARPQSRRGSRPPHPARPPLPPGRGELLRLIFVALFVLAAPTAGDIGSCNQALADLDARKFFVAKEQIDCAKCAECGFLTETCSRACDFEPNQTSFPAGCYPLIHDGEVCLRALDSASCDEYLLYVSDSGASVPTECNFCPLGGRQ
jgi:hypothetical protein